MEIEQDPDRLGACVLERVVEHLLGDLVQLLPSKGHQVPRDPHQVPRILRHLIKTGAAPPGLDEASPG